MLIAIDIGNTNIVVGFMDDDTVIATYRMTTKTRRTSDEYAVMLEKFMEMAHVKHSSITDIIISSVVPKVMHAFRASIIKFFLKEPIVIGPGIKCGINLRMDDPKSLGADRIADAVGAYYTYGGPVLVIDFGTATTYDYVDEHGVFRAGVISVGIETAANALWSQTAQLPEIEITRPTTILATATQSAMQAGLYYGCIGSVNHTIQQFAKELHTDFTVVATGGLGNVICSATEEIDVYDRNLIFKGMMWIYRNHMSKKNNKNAHKAFSPQGNNGDNHALPSQLNSALTEETPFLQQQGSDDVIWYKEQ